MTNTYAPPSQRANHPLQSLQNVNSQGEAFSTFSYAYDADGNAVTVTDQCGAVTYAYDALNQLTSAAYPSPSRGTVSYGYDLVGNRKSITQNSGTQNYSYDPGNELVSISGSSNTSFTYDNAGNMLTRNTGTATTNYAWDAMNRMTAAGSVTYLYDGDGHRVRKISGGVTVNYFYDGSSVVAETDGLGNIQKKYDPGVSVTDRQGTKLYYLYNGHGDVAGLMDANQNLVQSYEYDAFGNTVGDTKDPNPARYVGSGGVYSDDDLGLQYMWNRWYDPNLGRFVSRDPIGFKGGLNLYAYVGNNPINGIDSGGLCGSSLGIQAVSNDVVEGAGAVGDALALNAEMNSGIINETVEGGTGIRSFYNLAYGTSKYSSIALPSNGAASANISAATSGAAILVGISLGYQYYQAAQLAIPQQANAILKATAKTEGGLGGAAAGALVGSWGYAAGPVVGTVTTIGLGIVGGFYGASAAENVYNKVSNFLGLSP